MTMDKLHDRKRKYFDYAISAIVFFVVLLYAVHFNLQNYGAIYIPTPDGDLYLSIADNFIETGHFIQTSRPHEINFIVPPGLPMILTLIRCVGGGTRLIISLQYCLFALSAVFLMAGGGELCRGLKGNIVIPALFLFCLKTKAVNPGMILTETYTVFLLSLALYLFFCNRLSENTKVLSILAVFLLMVFIRPAMAGLIMLPIIHIFWLGFTKKPGKKFFASVALLAALFILGLFVNAGINKRETGYFIFLQNYGGISFYQANNANTKTYAYNSGVAAEFSDEYFFDVYNDSTLDTQEKTARLNSRTKQFILENPLFCIRNALGRYMNFLKTCSMRLVFSLISMLVLWCGKLLSWKKCAYLLGSFLILTVVPAFGLYIERYFIYHIVLTSTLSGSVVQFAFTEGIKRCKMRVIGAGKSNF